MREVLNYMFFIMFGKVHLANVVLRLYVFAGDARNIRAGALAD
jgi:hypothetical protein